MTTWKPYPQTYDQALHEIGCLEQQVADLQEQLAEAHQKIAALTEAQAPDMPHNAKVSGERSDSAALPCSAAAGPEKG